MAISDERPRPADAILGAQIRAARMSRQTSLRALSRALGVSPATISQIENGNTGLSVVRLGRIAEALNLDVSHILAIDVDPVNPKLPLAPPSPRPPAQPRSAVEPTGSDWRTYAPLNFDPVLQAALDEFVAIGYHGANMRSIAARCGLSVAGIYHHYTSKQQMLVTLLEYAMTDLHQRSEAARDEGRSPVERFSLLIENLTLYHTHRRELGFVGASEMRSFDAENRITIADKRSVQQRMIDVEVEAAVREGRFRADHPYEASRAVVTMCTALPTWWRPDGPLSPEQVAEHYVGFALDLMRCASSEERPVRVSEDR
ncbi:TetR family transcriptional regulator [Rhodococcus chondri]|uniref:TetR family transcriptional regulator n=1 Tax=Rhodococcus chondri TaxID=3065941 RepID=A0ABU7JN44_9NOCA|nr:TetR family transcriptional regulator [Rhodococcus sp. CC-R104]MEE2031299.1 TetR family transcriptional regulator [Rhodococcus sp. CC-R104]